MQAYVVASNIRIDPFGDLAVELPVGGVSLGKWQEDILKRLGHEVVRVSSIDDVPTDRDRLVVFDNVFFTRRVLKSFVKGFSANKRASRVALRSDSGFVRAFSDLQDYDQSGDHALYNLWAFAASSSNDLKGAEPFEVIYKEKLFELPVPKNVLGYETWSHPVTSSVCLHMHHWIHFLQANILSIQIRWADEVITRPFWAASRALFGLVPGRGRTWWKIGAKANKLGKGVDVHPTACVEGSMIGDGTTIGPQATVRGAIIGRNVTIDQRADVSFSVLGDGCFVSKHSIVYASAAFEDSDLCLKGIQMSLVGRRVGLSHQVIPMDTLPDKPIRVMHRGQLVEVGLKVLGSCFGHGSWVGPDIRIAPGRSIPNGTRMRSETHDVLAKIPSEIDPSKTYFVRNGTLE